MGGTIASRSRRPRGLSLTLPVLLAATLSGLSCGEATAPENAFAVQGSVIAPDGPVSGASVRLAFSGACTIGGCFESDRAFTNVTDASGAFGFQVSLPAGEGCRGTWRARPTHTDYYETLETAFSILWPADSLPCPFRLEGVRLTMEPYPPITILTDVLPEATVGVAYSAPLAGTRTRDIKLWSVAAGSLPAGLVLISEGESSRIEGTPTTAGTSEFTLELRTLDERDGSTQAALAITVS